MDTIAAYIIVYLSFDILCKNQWTVISNSRAGHCWIKKSGGISFCYYDRSCILRTEFSVTRLLYGNNAVLFNFRDKTALCCKVDSLLMQVLPGVRIVSFLRWIVTRIDYTAHFKVNTPTDKVKYLEAFSKIVTAHLKNQKFTSGSAKGNKSVRLNVYDKAEEIKIHNPSLSNPKWNNIFRFEVQLHGSKLRELSPHCRKVSDLISKDIAKQIISKYIHICNADNEMQTKSELSTIVCQAYPKKYNKVMDFVVTLNEKGKNDTMRKYSKSTYYRYITELKQKQINYIYLDENVSTKIDFNNFEYCTNECKMRRRIISKNTIFAFSLRLALLSNFYSKSEVVTNVPTFKIIIFDQILLPAFSTCRGPPTLLSITL
jgi:hypothetical protein